MVLPCRGEHRRILVVEDEQLSAELVRALLDDMGCHVTIAATGEQAVELAGKGGFSLILMDLILPGLDGMEATRRIRKSPMPREARTVPIVALTASTSRESLFACLDAGMNDYLLKPLDSRALYQMLLKWRVVEETDLEHHALHATPERRDSFDQDRVQVLRETLERDDFDAVIAQAVTSLSEHLAVIADASKDPEVDRRAFHRIVSLSSNLGFLELGDNARRHERSLGGGVVIDKTARSAFPAVGAGVLVRLKSIHAT